MRDTQQLSVVHVEAEIRTVRDDAVVVEEPLEVRLDNSSIGITMRTPGDDFDLAVGLLWTEGYIRAMPDVGTIAYCPQEEEPEDARIAGPTAKVEEAAGQIEQWLSHSPRRGPSFEAIEAELEGLPGCAATIFGFLSSYLRDYERVDLVEAVANPRGRVARKEA